MMKSKLFTKLIFSLIAIATLIFTPACGDKEKDEPTPLQTMEKMIIGKWEEKVSPDYKYSMNMGIEFRSDGTGVLWFEDEEDEGDEDFYIGTIQYKATANAMPNGGTEKVIQIACSFIDDRFTTYLSISYITEKKLIGKMFDFDGDSLENEDDWFSVNFERVEEFSWEK